MDEVERALDATPRGLIFANLVDFDTVYGHRNDPAGYAANLERFDARLAALLPRIGPGDLLIITADHGNDPTTPSTDHSREHVPLLVFGPSVRAGVDLGTRQTFADLGQTLAEFFGVGPLDHGTSFLADNVDQPTIRTTGLESATVNREERAANTNRRTMNLRTATRAARARDPRAPGGQERRQPGPGAPEAEDPIRPAFQRDRDRVIHCKAFRRLKHKTQVFFAPTGDHYRTRLTHTLEVSQIARSIAKVLQAQRGADRGDRARPRPRAHAVRPRRRARAQRPHPRRLQSLRAEPSHRRRARERRAGAQPDLGGARRHRAPLEGKSGMPVGADPEHRASTIEGQIARVADIIAYVNHDIDDAVRAGILRSGDAAEGARRGARATRRRSESVGW